jgi:hypothetical protein
VLNAACYLPLRTDSRVSGIDRRSL